MSKSILAKILLAGAILSIIAGVYIFYMTKSLEVNAQDCILRDKNVCQSDQNLVSTVLPIIPLTALGVFGATLLVLSMVLSVKPEK